MNESQHSILLVEDEPNDVFLIKRAFQKAKIVNPLHVASDGEQAMAYLAADGEFADRERFPLPTFILLDLKLPRKGGFEVLAWLRAQSGPLCRIPVVVLTSSRQSADINRAYDLGANSFLVKPVAFDTLLQVVQTLYMYWLIMNEKPDAERQAV